MMGGCSRIAEQDRCLYFVDLWKKNYSNDNFRYGATKALKPSRVLWAKNDTHFLYSCSMKMHHFLDFLGVTRD